MKITPLRYSRIIQDSFLFELGSDARSFLNLKSKGGKDQFQYEGERLFQQLRYNFPKPGQGTR